MSAMQEEEEEDKPTFDQLVDWAIAIEDRRATNMEEMTSYIWESYGVDMTTDENRASLTRALQGRIREGRVEEYNGSFYFTPRGWEIYDDEHEQPEEDRSASEVPGKGAKSAVKAGDKRATAKKTSVSKPKLKSKSK